MSIYDAMSQHVELCNGSYKDHSAQLYGKRCLAVVSLYYDDKDKIFHLQAQEGRLPCMMIQNTKKGFYIRRGDAILEYFYDSYEGWYIQSFHHGHNRQHQYSCEASLKYRQCDYGLTLNTDMVNMIYEYLDANRNKK